MRTSSSVNASSNKRMNGPIAHDALLSFALPSSSALRPSMSRRLTSLPSVAPSDAARAIAREHDFRFGIVPVRVARTPIQSPQPTDDSTGDLVKIFRIGADRDFEILRPQAIGDQCLLQARRSGRARLDRADVGADPLAELHRELLRLGGIAARALFDHAFDGRHGKRDAAGLDALQIER